MTPLTITDGMKSALQAGRTVQWFEHAYGVKRDEFMAAVKLRGGWIYDPQRDVYVRANSPRGVALAKEGDKLSDEQSGMPHGTPGPRPQARPAEPATPAPGSAVTFSPSSLIEQGTVLGAFSHQVRKATARAQKSIDHLREVLKAEGPRIQAAQEREAQAARLRKRAAELRAEQDRVREALREAKGKGVPDPRARFTPREVREWCRANGFPQTKDRGVYPAGALEAFRAAHLEG